MGMGREKILENFLPGILVKKKRPTGHTSAGRKNMNPLIIIQKILLQGGRGRVHSRFLGWPLTIKN